MDEIEKAIKEAGLAHDRRTHGRRKEDEYRMQCEGIVEELLLLVRRFRAWDALDIPDSDGDYWKKEIDVVLSKIAKQQESVDI